MPTCALGDQATCFCGVKCASGRARTYGSSRTATSLHNVRGPSAPVLDVIPGSY